MSDAEHQAGTRALKNTGVLAAAEIVGKFASLAVFAILARKLGEADLGVFVLAFAFLQIAVVPIELGFDRYLLRAVAKDRERLPGLLGNVLALKLTLAIPIMATAFLVASLLGYGEQTRIVIYVLALGVVLDGLTGTPGSALLAYERGELVALANLGQRLVSAALGITVLLAGAGVVAVGITYSAAALLGFTIAMVALGRHLGRFPLAVDRTTWRGLAGRSVPFAAQDIFTILLFKLDAVLLSLLANDAAVGRYGAAYRLLASTMFVAYALSAAYAAMFTYLDRQSDPPVTSVYGRSLKLALLALVPGAVAFGVLAGPLCELFFGPGLRDAAEPLELLAPVVVLLGLVIISSSLIVSRRPPRAMVVATAAMVILNVALNVALIPELEDSGAALAMLITYSLFSVVALALAAHLVGSIAWLRTAAAPLVAGAVMAGVLVLVRDVHPIPALLLGSLAYLVVLIPLERRIAPADFAFASAIVRRRLGRA